MVFTVLVVVAVLVAVVVDMAVEVAVLVAVVVDMAVEVVVLPEQPLKIIAKINIETIVSINNFLIISLSYNFKILYLTDIIFQNISPPLH